MYDNNFLNLLKEKIVLSDVISRSVRLINRGRNKVACCPFHKEKTPSFNVNDDKGFYHCFGCGAHGDVITFTMNQDGLSFKDAVEKLATENGIELPKLKNSTKNKEELDTIHIVQDINEKSCLFFQKCIFENIGKRGLNYIIKRGLNTDSVKKFKIGFAPDDFASLIEYLKSCGFSEKQMELAGVVARNNNGNYYDKFRNRVMFPVLDKNGKVIAFTGRVINKDDMPKYMNSPETAIYHKSDVLFNYFFAKKSIYDNKNVILVEGNLDAITLSVNGIENVVAPMGTAITLKQIEILWKATDEIIVCLDGDSAGQKASLRLANLVLPILTPMKNMKFVFLPKDQDPDDFVKNNGKMVFLDYINDQNNCFSLSEFLWKNEISTIKSLENNKYITPEEKSLLETKFSTITKQINDPLVSKNFEDFYKRQIFLISKYTGNKKATNYRTLTKIDYKKNVKSINSVDLLKQNVINIEKQMFSLMISYLPVVDQIFQTYNVDMFNMEYTDSKSNELIGIFLKLYEANDIENKELLLNILEKNNFNDYIINSGRYNHILDSKKVNYLYSLVIERNINTLEIEVKNLSFKNDNESKRKNIMNELDELRSKKNTLDDDFNY
ncbi:MAG: DNA primase [Rickettsiales bacterium]|nr:DNA primase [Rickettsiales bacterium]